MLELVEREVALLLERTAKQPLEPHDIVSDPRTVTSLSLLYNSMHWLVAKLSELRHVDDDKDVKDAATASAAAAAAGESGSSNSTSSSRPPSASHPHQHHHGNAPANARRWTLISSVNMKWDSFSEAVYLPMTPGALSTFDKMLASFRGLALTTLLTLHVDIRCGTIHVITRNLLGVGQHAVTTTPPGGQAMQSQPHPQPHPQQRRMTPSQSQIQSQSQSQSRSQAEHAPFVLSAAPTAASQAIVELNNDLIAFDANIRGSLGGRECRFITFGLAKLADHAFLRGVQRLAALNTNGALKLQLDVLVLQQNLKNIIVCDASPLGGGGGGGGGEGAGAETPFVSRNEDIALPRTAKFIDWFLAGAKVALAYAKAEKEVLDAMSPAEKAERRATLEETPFSHDELRALVELCFSAALRGPGAKDGSREDYFAAKKEREEALGLLEEYAL
ncbi:hypothetical protein KEM52_000979 [Ascosphaera acerosa]|nr:hypothetical protein KEM52_000979 [Ascosphaera acerosa]